MNKILIVEDDRELNKSIETFLVSYDYEIKSFYNGLDALDYLSTNECDLVISDIMMPLMDGFFIS